MPYGIIRAQDWECGGWIMSGSVFVQGPAQLDCVMFAVSAVTRVPKLEEYIS